MNFEPNGFMVCTDVTYTYRWEKSCFFEKNMKKEAKSRDAIMTTDTLSNDFESITHAFPLHSFPSSNFALPYAKSFFFTGTN